jgi:NAD(P)-dependent dehydrogenase (short-subunit alcohol dehydrogenase family)
MPPPATIAPLCIVAGVGPGNGAAFVRTFSAAGYRVAMLARSHTIMAALAEDLRDVHAYPCDLGHPAAIDTAFAAIGAALGPPDVLIYNASKGVWGDIERVSAADFEAGWRVTVLGCFAASRSVIPLMTEAGRGAIIIIGATASTRGMAGTAAFAPAKAAQRTLAQSLARHLGPRGIHVAHIIVDGAIGGPATRARYPNRADDTFIDPAAIAQTALDLVRQPRSAWTFELDLRPFNEKW